MSEGRYADGCEYCAHRCSEAVLDLERQLEQAKAALREQATTRHVLALELHCIGHEQVDGGFSNCPHAACDRAARLLANLDRNSRGGE